MLALPAHCRYFSVLCVPVSCCRGGYNDGKKMSASSGKVQYHGNCHCGKYRFELLMPEITSGMECTCRQCKKKGYRWVAVSGDRLTVVKDDGSLTEYNSGVLIDKVHYSAAHSLHISDVNTIASFANPAATASLECTLQVHSKGRR